MKTALVTGSAGLVGSAISRLLLNEGWQVYGLDNDMRALLFGREASTKTVAHDLQYSSPRYYHTSRDVRRPQAVRGLIQEAKPDFIVHAAGQPSHEWSALHPVEDFKINAMGTLSILEAARELVPASPFAFLSTNKVYGDLARWKVDELPTRYGGYTADELVPVDRTLHTPFGVSKLAADVMVQEYGRYYGLPTVCFRCGCITGAAHKAVEAHGFLAYLVKCAVQGMPYTVYGYGGKQVRDQLHASDLAWLLLQFYENPCAAGEVFNVGGGQENSISIREALCWLAERGYNMSPVDVAEPRRGDHRFYVTDLAKVRAQWPAWKLEYNLEKSWRSYWHHV